jgi:hypothetical protein
MPKKKKSHPFLWSWLSVLLAVTISDFVWTKYVGGISSAQGLSAALWASGVILLGAYITTSYVGDKRLIVPAAIGAFIGTYLGV